MLARVGHVAKMRFKPFVSFLCPFTLVFPGDNGMD
jgi:hypothetical protein